MKRLRIGVLMGGSSSEREVSLRTGEAVALSLEDAGHDVIRLELGGGRETVQMLSDADMDVAFLALHGRYGEDGCVQGLLELLGIPYTGSSVMASALAMDKLKSKELFRLHNVPTPPYYSFERSLHSLSDLKELHGSFGYPAMVKPRREGSSVGLKKVNDFGELERAVSQALEFDDAVLIERFVRGREVTVGLLDGRILGAIEIEPKSGIYDFASKYTPGATEYHLPVRLPAVRAQNILNLAERAAAALETRGPVRVDLIATEGQNEYVLEVNTLPGMTETSLLPKIAKAAGFSFAALCEAIVQGARLHNLTPASAGQSERVATLATPPAFEGDGFDESFDESSEPVSASAVVAYRSVVPTSQRSRTA
jgi:D-alanine-D-alanine ligase